MSRLSAEPSNRPHVSSRRATVIVEEPAQTRSSANAADILRCRSSINQFVIQALVIPFTVVMCDELRQCPSQVAFPEGNHAVEALMLDRAHKAFRVGVRVGRLIRVCTTRIPASPSRSRTDALHFASRSQIST